MEARFEQAGLVAEQVQTACCDVHTWIGGRGPPVMLLQGFGGDALVQWDQQVGPFAEDHTLLVPDLVFFGASTGPPERATLELQVEAMLGVAAARGIERFDVVGVSYGGLVAWWMAVTAPERVRRLVLVDSPGTAFDAGDLGALLEHYGVDSTAELLLPDQPDDIPRLMSLVEPRPPRLPGVVLRDVHDVMFTTQVEEKRALLDDLLGRMADAPDLPVPQQPTLLVWGEHDRVFPLPIAHRLLERLPDAELVVVEGALHGPNVSHPDAFNAAVTPFLSGR